MKYNNFTLFNRPFILIFIIFNFGFSSEILKNCELIIQSSISNIDSLIYDIFSIPPNIMKKVEKEFNRFYYMSNLFKFI